MNKKIILGIIIISVSLFLWAIFFLSKDSASTQKLEPVVTIDYSSGQKFGNENAKVKLVEFSDFECPACKLIEPFVESLRQKYKDQSFELIYKHFPLSQHPHAKAAAELSEYAASQGKFWQVHDKLFETQPDFENLKDATDYFVNLGAEFGLDKNKIRDAITKEEFAQKINQNLEEGQRIGVYATPTFYLNGRKLDLKTVTDLDNFVSEALKQN